MPREVLEGLAVKPGGVYLDGTAGGGGHAAAILEGLGGGGRLICIDKDPDAVEALEARFKGYGNVAVIRGDFRDADALLDGKTVIDGALLDLGVSSHQLDSAERGFSYLRDGALDMRMTREGPSAYELVNEAGISELTAVLRDYGEEAYAGLIARKIAKIREQKPIGTTAELFDAVVSSLPPAVRRKEKNPARKTFQALRMAVNDEMGALNEGMARIFDLLAPGGRFCIITFHSVEDRAVKRYFQSLAAGCVCPPDFPVCVCGRRPKARMTPKKPVTAAEEELKQNRRARSAKLRILEKL